MRGDEREEYKRRVQTRAAKPGKASSEATQRAIKDYPSLKPLEKSLVISDYEHPEVQEMLKDLSTIPESLHAQMVDFGVKVYLGNATVPSLNNAKDLKGVRPAGWPPDKTWDQVPGAYRRSSKTIIVGVGKHAGSSIASHEYGHAVSHMINERNPYHSVELKDMHIRAFGRLPAYLQQGGPGGFRGADESFAEAFAVTYDASRDSRNDYYEQALGYEFLNYAKGIR